MVRTSPYSALSDSAAQAAQCQESVHATSELSCVVAVGSGLLKWWFHMNWLLTAARRTYLVT